MSIFTKIGTAIKDAFTDPIALWKKLETIFNQVEEDQPELRVALVGLVGQLETVGVDLATDYAAEGLNLPGDLKLIQDAIAAVQYFKANVEPLIEKIYGQVKTDLAPAAIPAAATAVIASAAGASSAPQAGPGLHTVVKA